MNVMLGKGRRWPPRGLVGVKFQVQLTFSLLAMPLKKVDGRVRTLIENSVAQRHRCMFIVVGDKGRDQVSS